MDRGVVKVFGRGEVGETMMILILPITKIFYKNMLATWYVNLNKHFLAYFVNNSLKIAYSYDFLAENRFLPILCVYFQYAQNFEVALTL